MKLFSKVAAGALLSIALSVSAFAGPIDGSLAVAAFGVTQNGADLLASTLYTGPLNLSSGIGVNDFAPVPLGTSYGGFSLDMTTLASGGGFALSNATYGDFIATSGFILPGHSSSILSILFLGTYNPGVGLPGTTSNAASFHASFTFTGGSISESGTLASPPEQVGAPEPATMLLLGSALFGLGFIRRRRAA